MRRAYDLIVVGAGVIGLSCAWRCAQAGLRVVVLERGEPGTGASGVAAGMLAPVTEASFGEESLLRLNLAARGDWPGFAAELEELTALPTGYRDSGAVVVAADRDDAAELRRLHAFQVELGLAAEWLTPRALREIEPGLSPRVAGGILANQDGQTDPGAVLLALAHALEAAGGELRVGSEVTEIVAGPEGVRGARLAAGEVVPGGQVLAACGAWSGEGAMAIELQAPPVRPVKGQLLELRTRPGRPAPARHVVRSPRCYVVTRADGMVILGATQEEQGFDTTTTADGAYRLLEAAWEILPDLGELELIQARAGLRPGTPDNMPVVGPGELTGLIWATGHHRNGVMLAPATANAVVSQLTRGAMPDSFAPFSPERFDGVRAG